MSLHTERRVVLHAGRRFVVSAPTVETVLMAVRLFASEIVILRKEYLQDALTEGVWVDVASKMLTAKGRASADVLATCCTLWQGAPGELEMLAQESHPLRESLARAVVSLCDPAAIAGRMSWEAIDGALSDAAPGDDDRPDGPSAIDILVVTVAQVFHQPPAAVMGWPYEMVTELFETLLPACQAYGKSQPASDTASAETLARYGVH